MKISIIISKNYHFYSLLKITAYCIAKGCYVIGLTGHFFVFYKIIFVFIVVAMSDRVHDVETIDRLFQKLHYENMSLQYEAISKSGKNDIFRCKNMAFFLIFAQNIDCGYTLEPPPRRF